MTVRRLPRGTRLETVALGWKVERGSKRTFEAMAANADVSAAVFFEKVVDHLEQELTLQGLPSWWPAQEPADGELPIDTA
jgi:hypothetical protein